LVKGFEPPEQRLRLRFEDGEWAGAEVVCVADAPFGVLLKFEKWREMADPDSEEIAGIMRQFGDDILIEWNLTHKGEPRIATGEGFLGLGMVAQLKIIGAWLQGIGQMATPLAQAGSPSSMHSANGGTKPRARSSRKAAA